MIDTMQLLLTDYEVSGAKLNLQPSTIDTATGEMKANYPLYKDGEEWITGARAYHRDEHFNVSMQPQFKNDGAGVGTACYVRFEVPKFAGESNYHPVDFKGTREALRTAETLLKDVGIKTNIETAKISRLDVFKNVVADEPFSCYQPVLALLSGTRMKQRGYENGFLWENTRQEVCVYDKLQKMHHDRLPVVGLPGNSIRFEHRMKQAQKVRDTLSFSNVRELFEDYSRIDAVYRETMKKQLFKYSVPEVEVMFASELKTRLRFYQEHYGARWFQKFLMEFGLQSLLQKMSMETVIDAVDEVGENKMKKSRIKRDLQQMRFASATLSLVPSSSRTNGELYDELEAKLLAA
jgi:hypothetical protein